MKDVLKGQLNRFLRRDVDKTIKWLAAPSLHLCQTSEDPIYDGFGNDPERPPDKQMDILVKMEVWRGLQFSKLRSEYAEFENFRLALS